jgi:hypothetical protein
MSIRREEREMFKFLSKRTRERVEACGAPGSVGDRACRSEAARERERLGLAVITGWRLG